jgi:hypothetical protein
MLYEIADSERRKAKFPHELFMLNLALFHLLLAPVAIVLDIGVWGFLIPLLASFSVITFTFFRSRRAEHGAPWFVAAHWKLAMRRYRILFIVYLISSAIVGIGLLIGMGSEDRNMAGIMLAVFSRIAAAPLLIGVILCFVLESGSIYQAGRGEVPEMVVKRCPPPPDVEAKENTASG